MLLPKENSGVPGARDTRPVPQGMESRIPTLFSDISEQLKHNPKQRIVVGERSDISGQDPEQMITLNTVCIMYMYVCDEHICTCTMYMCVYTVYIAGICRAV